MFRGLAGNADNTITNNKAPQASSPLDCRSNQILRITPLVRLHSRSHSLTEHQHHRAEAWETGQSQRLHLRA